MRLFKAILVILFLPALIAVINTFQDYADAEMTLQPWQQVILDAWPFILIALVALGIFMAIRHMTRGRGE